MTRVVHIYKDYYPVLGGIENHLRSLGEEQVRRGYDVTVVAASPGMQEDDKVVRGVRVLLVPRLATLCSTPLCPGLVRRLTGLDADLFHLHFPHPPGEVARLLLRDGVPTVVTYHSDIVKQRRLLKVYAPLLRRVLGRADRILVTSPPYARTSPWLRPVRHKCTIVPLGIRVERFDPDMAGDRRLTTRLRYGLPADAPVVVFVGRMRYYKGLDHLLRALELVPSARLLIVGDGPLAGEARGLAATLGISSRVVFAGNVDDADLPGCYHAADVFVLPSTLRAEAFGTSLLEAMSSGLPSVTTELGTGTSWVNQVGCTGLVVPPADHEALAAAMRVLLGDADLRRKMGEAARRRALKTFQLSTMADAVDRVYGALLAEHCQESAYGVGVREAGLRAV